MLLDGPKDRLKLLQELDELMAELLLTRKKERGRFRYYKSRGEVEAYDLLKLEGDDALVALLPQRAELVHNLLQPILDILRVSLVAIL